MAATCWLVLAQRAISSLGLYVAALLAYVLSRSIGLPSLTPVLRVVGVSQTTSATGSIRWEWRHCSPIRQWL